MSMHMQPMAQKLFGYPLNVMDIKTSVSEWVYSMWICANTIDLSDEDKTQRVTLVLHTRCVYKCISCERVFQQWLLYLN